MKARLKKSQDDGFFLKKKSLERQWKITEMESNYTTPNPSNDSC